MKLLRPATGQHKDRKATREGVCEQCLHRQRMRDMRKTRTSK
jgi:hypothetical protein